MPKIIADATKNQVEQADILQEVAVAFSDGKWVNVRLIGNVLAEEVHDVLRSPNFKPECGEWQRTGRWLILDLDTWRGEPIEVPRGEASVKVESVVVDVIANRLLDLLKSPVLWQPMEMDPSVVRSVIPQLDQMASMPELSDEQRQALCVAAAVCENHIRREVVEWPKRTIETIPDKSLLRVGVEMIPRLASLPGIDENEQAGLRAVYDLGTGGLEDKLAVVANSRTSVKSLVDKVRDMSPEEFFAWFDLEMARIPQTKLQTVVKSWIARQAGKHGFVELEANEAVKRKRDLASGVQDVLDRSALKIVCEHAFRDTGEVCGQVGRLNAILRGNSLHGQFVILHNTRLTGNVKHSSSTVFPSLKLS